MRRTTWILLLALAAAVWTAESGAGWFDRNRKATAHDRPEPHRYGDTPQRVLLTGALTPGRADTWRLGDRELRLMPGCNIEIDGQPSHSLVPAEEALVLGTPIGNVVMARQVRIRRPGRPDLDTETDEQRYGIQWSESNPNVGVGTIKGIE